MRSSTTFVLAALLAGVVACSGPWVGSREGSLDLQEWQGVIVELNRDRGYMVVRSQERLLDHTFRITSRTEITSRAAMPPPLERGRSVIVQYGQDGSGEGPPVALRVVVIR